MSKLLASSKAPSTCSKYTLYWNRWVTWVTEFNGSSPLPADSATFAIYLSRLICQSESKSIIEATMASVSYFHCTAGLPSPTLDPFVKAIGEGGRRVCAKPVCKKEPIVRDNVVSFAKVLEYPNCSWQI